MAKWNEALRIEEALGSKARFAGIDEMPMRAAGAKAGRNEFRLASLMTSVS